MTSPANHDRVHQAAWQDHLAWAGWFCCALSVAFVQAIPTIPAVIFVGTVLLYSALFPLRAYKALLWNFVPWMIVVLGALTTIWSDQPILSLRAAVQIGITTLAAIMFAQGLQAYSFIAIVMYALLASIVANLYVPGIFGAKNSLGLTLALLMLSSCWVMLGRQQPKLTRMVALAALLGAPPMLVAAGSEGALLAGGFALLCSFVPLLLRPLPSNTRIALICFGVLGVCIALGIATLLIDNLVDLALLAINKDVSLTGRTLLWSHAVDIIADHPFGLGLQAFWVEGNREAERFWAFFYIYSHTGFHFHDLWLEMGVELGVIGMLIAALTTLTVFFNVIRWVLHDPGPESCFFTGFVTFVVSRTFGEVELYVQFSLIPMIFLAGYCYADTAWNRRSDLKPRCL